METTAQEHNHNHNPYLSTHHESHTEPQTYYLSPPHTSQTNSQEQAQNYLEPKTEPTEMDYLCTIATQQLNQINNPPSNHYNRHILNAAIDLCTTTAHQANLSNNATNNYHNNATFYSQPTEYDSDLLTEPPTPHQHHDHSPREQPSSTTTSPISNYTYNYNTPDLQSSTTNPPQNPPH
jgi:hypothetical protein